MADEVSVSMTCMSFVKCHNQFLVSTIYHILSVSLYDYISIDGEKERERQRKVGRGAARRITMRIALASVTWLEPRTYT